MKTVYKEDSPTGGDHMWCGKTRIIWFTAHLWQAHFLGRIETKPLMS